MAFYTHTLEEGEHVAAVVRSHIIGQLGKIIAALLVLLAPFFFMVPLFSWGTYGIAVFATGIVLGVFMMLRVWVIAYSDSLIITNYRIIDWNQRGIFDRIVSDIDLEDVHEVSFRIHGLFGTMLHIGSVYVHSDQDQVALTLPAVKNPVRVQALIRKLTHQL